MFSDAERNLNQDTLEYAWLLEIQLGKLSGKATAPQVRFIFCINYLFFHSFKKIIVTILHKVFFSKLIDNLNLLEYSTFSYFFLFVS